VFKIGDLFFCRRLIQAVIASPISFKIDILIVVPIKVKNRPLRP
jgi:hypothetical protein